MAAVTCRTFGRLVLWGTFVRVTRSDMRRVRKELGRRLPDDYRRFIDVANGGVLPYAVDLPPGAVNAEPIEFSKLHTITPGRSGDFSWGTVLGEKRHLDGAYIAEILPSDVVPIASDGSGSSLYLRLHPDHFGEVWAFVHGLPDWAGGNQRDSGGLVSPSFDAFLETLYIHDESAELQWRDAQEADDWLRIVEVWLDSGLPDWRSRPWATGAS
jgi:SMI1 / KNR4 family (SUKH-1)